MGHTIVAEVARRVLSEEDPSLVDRVNQITQVESPYFDEKYTTLPVAGTWMDKIKDDTNTFDTQHYLDIPVERDGVVAPRPDRTNIATSLEMISDTLIFSPKSHAWGKGLTMMMLVHFVGDMHQPLHASELWSNEFPDGDQGGNLFKITYAEDVPDAGKLAQYNQMHLLFDACGGLYTGYAEDADFNANLRKNTDELMRDFPIENYPIEKLNPSYTTKEEFMNNAVQPWLTESNDIAAWAYDQLIATGHQVSQAFLQEARQKLRERVALAGYRLSYILKRVDYTMRGKYPTASKSGTDYESATYVLVAILTALVIAIVFVAFGGVTKLRRLCKDNDMDPRVRFVDVDSPENQADRYGSLSNSYV